MSIFHDSKTSPDLGIYRNTDTTPVTERDSKCLKIFSNAAILNQNEPTPIKIRQRKFKVPRLIKHNTHLGSNRSNNQILNDILRIIDRYIVPANQKHMIEELLNYSTDLPELRSSGLPWIKQDYVDQKSKYLKSQNLSLNKEKPTI